MFDLKS